MAKVYLETSYVSACVSKRTDPASLYRLQVSNLRTICRRLGYVPPAIVTPDMLWSDRDEQDETKQ